MTARVPVLKKYHFFLSKTHLFFGGHRRWALRLMHGTSGKHGWGLPSRIKDGWESRGVSEIPPENID